MMSQFGNHLGVPLDYQRRALRFKSSPITAAGFPLQSLTQNTTLNYDEDNFHLKQRASQKVRGAV